jgi:hypothetical protein
VSWFFQDLETKAEGFPKPWKIEGGFFQALATAVEAPEGGVI